MLVGVTQFHGLDISISSESIQIVLMIRGKRNK